MRGDKYIRLGLDFAHLQTAMRALERIDVKKSLVPLQDDFVDAVDKLKLIHDFMYETVVEELVNGVKVFSDQPKQNHE